MSCSRQLSAAAHHRWLSVLMAASWAAILSGCASERPIYYQIESKYSVHDPQFAQTMGNLLGPPLVKGNSCQTLINGDEIFPAMLLAISGAKKSITFETFIYWKGTIGKQFADAFAELRASRGKRGTF